MRRVRWMTAYLDTPESDRADRDDFWCAISGSLLSEPITQVGERRVLVPQRGHPYIRSRTVGELAPRVHLDINARSADSMVQEGLRAGGTLIEDNGGFVRLRSPAGLEWCVTRWGGERAVPPPCTVSPPLFEGVAVASRLDQVCVDIPDPLFDREAQYWATVTGWRVVEAVRPDFVMLYGRGQPLRLLLRRDHFYQTGSIARAHVDVAAGGAANLDRLVAWHESLGARRGVRHAWWMTMIDPAGSSYCLTRRDPVTGSILR